MKEVRTLCYDTRTYDNLLHAPVASLLQTNPWRFAGGYFDSATGFTKFGVRYYDATVGRWTQQDPKAGSLFDPRSSNRYVYAKCDPVNVTDPGGKQATGGDFWGCMLGSTGNTSKTLAGVFVLGSAIALIAGILGLELIAGIAGVIAAIAVILLIKYCLQTQLGVEI